MDKCLGMKEEDELKLLFVVKLTEHGVNVNQNESYE